MILQLATGQVNLRTRVVSRNGGEGRLSAIEARLLRYLVEHIGQTVPREDLYMNVWKYRKGLRTRTLDLAVSRLRKKIETDPREPTHLLTDYGSGYVFVPVGEKPIASPTSVPTPAKTNLAKESNEFVGREEEKVKITELMSDSRGCVTVLGPTGVGKSRLLRHWATEQFAEGVYNSVCWCDLSGAYTEEDILNVVETSLGIDKWQEQKGTSNAVKAVGAAIASIGNTLIVLDNVEQIVEPMATCLQQWWSMAPEARFLVTSQVPLDISGEQRFQLSPLSFQGQSAEDNPSLALFLERAISVQPEFKPTREDLKDILDIVSALDGLPLAIELAASRIRHFPPAALKERMKEQFKLLRQSKNTGPKRHMSLKAGLDWSWEMLTPWERAALAQCSVFCGGFDWEAVESVVDLSAWDEAPWALDTVAALVDKSLISIRELPGGTVRLSMLNTIATYAANRLKEMGETEAFQAAERHAIHYAGLGRPNHHLRHGSLAQVRYLHIELSNLRTAIQRSLHHGWSEPATRCVIAILKIIRMTGPYGPYIEIANSVLEMSVAQEERTRLLEMLGLVNRLMGRMEDAERLFLEALDIRRTTGHTNGEGIVLGNLAYLYMDLGQIQIARSYFEQSVQLCRDTDDISNAGAALNGLGAISAKLGQMEEAKKYFHESLTVARSQKSRFAEAVAHSNLGRICVAIDENALALRHFNKALEMFEEVNARQSQGRTLAGLANLYHALEQYDEAANCWQRALTLQRQVGVRIDEGLSLFGLSKSWMAMGKLDKARDTLGAAEVILREGKNPGRVVRLLSLRGLLECRFKHFEAAREALVQLEAMMEESAVEPDVWLTQDIEALKKQLQDAP